MATGQLDTLLREARALLTNKGREVLAPFTEAKARWDSLSGHILTAIKAKEGLGSLDAGVERLNKILNGNEWDVLFGNTDAIFNDAVKGNLDKYKTNLRASGRKFLFLPNDSMQPTGPRANTPRAPALPKGITLPPGAKADTQKGTVTMYSGTQPVTVKFGDLQQAIGEYKLTFQPGGAQ